MSDAVPPEPRSSLSSTSPRSDGAPDVSGVPAAPARGRVSRLAYASALALVAAPLFTYVTFLTAGGKEQVGWDALGTALLALFGGMAILFAGFVSGVVALVRIRRNPALRGSVWAGIGVTGSLLVLAFFVWQLSSGG